MASLPRLYIVTLLQNDDEDVESADSTCNASDNDEIRHVRETKNRQ